VNAVELEALCVELGGRRVLGPVDLALEERSWTLLVGASGSGKTTLLRAIAGLAQPSAGRVFFDGHLASDGARLALAPERRAIGFVFQGAGAGLWPHLSARATLAFVLRCRGVARGEHAARIGEMLALVGLDALAERRPGELSGGEAQRLALARALIVRPRLLLLDEPLAALDAPLRLDMTDSLAELHRRLGTTILHVTHDAREVEARVDRTLVLEGGALRPSTQAFEDAS
jgi:ABC-type sulfate/molybdate transport systems ATPase subunit